MAKKQRKWYRILLIIVLSFLCLLLLGAGAIAIYAKQTISFEDDKLLFESAGQSTVTRLYCHNAENSETVEGLNGYSPAVYANIIGNEKCLRKEYEDFPKHLVDAFVAIEDHRFYEHDGVDWLRTIKAGANYLFHFDSKFGGSSITQQLIKNISADNANTPDRKLREIIRAVAIEQSYSKEEVMTAYLNIVPLGHNILGVGAASQYYFNKDVSQLTPAESATLAAITNSPVKYDPIKKAEACLGRRDLILSKMLSFDFITQDEYTTAINEKMTTEAYELSTDVYSWYTETVISDVLHDLCHVKGFSKDNATALIYGGGLSIYTAVDPAMQATLESYFEDPAHFPKGKDDLLYAMTVIDPDNGHLLALVGNRGEKDANRILNYATNTLRSPGSVLKPVALYAPALEKGIITPLTVMDDVPIFTKQGDDYTAWPHNYPSVYQGLTDMRQALTQSKNTVAVSLYDKLGSTEVYRHLTENHYLTSIVRQAYNESGQKITDLAPAPLALGQMCYGVNVREMTSAYVPLANGGTAYPSTSYLLVLDRHGNILLDGRKDGKTVYSPQTAYLMTDMLRGVTEEGTASSLTLTNFVETAGKTGTSGEDRDRWFIGYTPQYVAGIWCGYATGNQAVGNLAPTHLAVWDGVMRELSENTTEAESVFKMPNGLTTVTVCRDSGKLPCEACHKDPRGNRIVKRLVQRSEVPKETCDCHVLVAYDTEHGGVLSDKACYQSANYQDVGLLDIPWRDFPKQLYIVDAEYVYRPLNGSSPSFLKTEPYFQNTLLPGHHVGISMRRDGKQFNRYALVYPKEISENEE